MTRFFWVGASTVLSSIVAVLGVRAVAVALLRPEAAFMPLTVTPAIIDTALFVTLAVLVFHRVLSGGQLPGPLLALLGRGIYMADPIQTFKAIAARVLLLSFVPLIAVALSDRGRWSYAFALAAMHVAAWAVCVTMLARLTPKDHTSTTS